MFCKHVDVLQNFSIELALPYPEKQSLCKSMWHSVVRDADLCFPLASARGLRSGELHEQRVRSAASRDPHTLPLIDTLTSTTSFSPEMKQEGGSRRAGPRSCVGAWRVASDPRMPAPSDVAPPVWFVPHLSLYEAEHCRYGRAIVGRVLHGGCRDARDSV